jgi:hypothetical protein
MKRTPRKIKVLKQDIEKGEPHSQLKCPIALAIQRETGQEYKVCRTYIRFASGAGSDLPHKVADWINAFDAGQHVKPIEFTVLL